MIPIGLVAGVASLAVIVHDFWRYPSDPFTVFRVPVAGVWAAVWLTYGINPAGFPAPEATSVVLLVAAWTISLMVVPGPPAPHLSGSEGNWDERTIRIAFAIVLGISVAVVAWNLWFLLARAGELGIAMAIAAQRMDRTNKTGAYGIPGAEALSAIAVVTGVLGYGLWVRDRRPAGLMAAIVGLMDSALATGRWDLVSYGMWCFAVDILLRPRQSARPVIVPTIRLFALLTVLFVVHGELLGKVDVLIELADMPVEQRQAVANAPDNLGDDPVAPRPRAGTGLEPFPTTGPSRSEALRQSAGAPRLADCERWAQGADLANDRFRRLPALVGVGVTYFAGPIAAFDRAVCEHRMASRAVVFYWPLKVGAALDAVARPRGPRVDPFIDIGVPFNNYTVFYPLLSELGPTLGILAWLVTALAARRFVRWSISRGGSLPLLVAGAAPMTIAIRTPWINAFFDGTLVIWVGVCLALAALAWLSNTETARLSAVRPARTSDLPEVATESAGTAAPGTTARRTGS